MTSFQKHSFRIGELFSGPGGIAKGIDLAAETQGVDVIHSWASDYCAQTAETYKKNITIEPKNYYTEDVHGLDIEKLSAIDGFAFGFPCNDFSQVGERKGIKGKFGPLYSYGVAVIEKFKPKFFLAENVGGLRSSNKGNTLGKILEELRQAGLGYSVVPHYYKFEEYGIPQARHRIIMIGIRKDLGLSFEVPAPTHIKKYKTCKEAILTPPISEDAYNNELTRQSKVVVERLNHIKAGQNAFDSDLPEHLKLNVKGAKISQIYKRLDPEKPSYTVTGSGGGGTHVYHWEESRALTNRERARLQTFPDDFEFKGSKESVRKQIGMAVPVEGTKVIMEAVFKTFRGVLYDSIDANMGYQNETKEN